MIPSGTGHVRGHASTITNSGRPYISPSWARVSDTPGMPKPGCMAYLRESFSSRGVSPEASKLLLSSWRPKTQSSYNSAFAKWASWCQQRNRDPTFGPIEDIVNFLSESFGKGLQYRSLNSYRSVISAVHDKVDGLSVGQHPLLSRLLRGAFNERPPLPRYSSFWNVDVVLTHLRGLGGNGSLSLKTLTLKTVMLMALARPARSADLANLDIRHQSITDAGIIFQPRHLSKQSRSSKPIQEFFYPRFPEDEVLCPLQALLAYEECTAAFRSPQGHKTLLFLSWIGKHDPVSSSSIARWLKLGLEDAGVDTSIFKGHSTRGASSSKAAASGVTVSDILQAADWSSEGTFQRFYHRQSSDKSTFGKAVLAGQASNLHVDIETEPSEM